MLSDADTSAIWIPSFATDFDDYGIFAPDTMMTDRYLNYTAKRCNSSEHFLLRTANEYSKDRRFVRAPSATQDLLPQFARCVQQRLDRLNDSLRSLGVQNDVFYVDKACLLMGGAAKQEPGDPREFTLMIALRDGMFLPLVKADGQPFPTCNAALTKAGDAVMFASTSLRIHPNFDGTIALIICSCTTSFDNVGMYLLVEALNQTVTNAATIRPRPSPEAMLRFPWTLHERYNVHKLEATGRAWAGNSGLLSVREWRVLLTKTGTRPFTTFAVEKRCGFAELLATFALQRLIESLSVTSSTCGCYPVPLMSQIDRTCIWLHEHLVATQKHAEDGSSPQQLELVGFAHSIRSEYDEIDDALRASSNGTWDYNLEVALYGVVLQSRTRIFTSVTPPGWINVTCPFDTKPELLARLFTAHTDVRQSCLQQLARCVTTMTAVLQHRDWHLRNVPICTPDSEACADVHVAIVDFDASDVHDERLCQEMTQNRKLLCEKSEGLVLAMLDEINTLLFQNRVMQIAWCDSDKAHYRTAISATATAVARARCSQLDKHVVSPQIAL